MKIVKFLIGALLSFITYFFILAPSSLAMCPICTIAVGAGLGLSRYLGIDDSITGIWVGGLITSLSFWSLNWLVKKYKKNLTKINNRILLLLILSLWYTITFIPLYLLGILGHPFNRILGVDKLIFGSFAGIMGFIFGYWADKKVRKLKGKQLFQYQKVAFPLLSLAIISLIFYYYGGYLNF